MCSLYKKSKRCYATLIFLFFSLQQFAQTNHSLRHDTETMETEYGLCLQFLDAKEYEKTYEHLSKFIYLATEQDDSLSLIKGQSLLALLNTKLKHYPRAIKAYEKALAYGEAIGLVEENFNHYVLLAKLYEREHNYKALIQSCIFGIDCFASNVSLHTVSNTALMYEMKALLFYAYHKEGKDELAMNLLDEMIIISNKVKPSSIKNHIKLFLGEYYMDHQDYSTAQQYFDEIYAAIQIAENKDYLLITIEKLALLAKKKNELEKAVELFALALEYNKTIGPIGEDSLPDISDWEDRYKIKSQDIVINNLKDTHEHTNFQLKDHYQKIFMILMASALLIFVSIFLSVRKRKLNQRKQELSEENRVLHHVKTELDKANENIQDEMKGIQKLLRVATIENEKDNGQKKYAHSNLSDAQKAHLKELFLSILKKEKIFLDPNITLDALAIKLEINRSYLSQFINEQFENNFNQLMNHYRVLEACRLLGDKNNAQYTIHDRTYCESCWL